MFMKPRLTTRPPRPPPQRCRAGAGCAQWWPCLTLASSPRHSLPVSPSRCQRPPLASFSSCAWSRGNGSAPHRRWRPPRCPCTRKEYSNPSLRCCQACLPLRVRGGDHSRPQPRHYEGNWGRGGGHWGHSPGPVIPSYVDSAVTGRLLAPYWLRIGQGSRDRVAKLVASNCCIRWPSVHYRPPVVRRTPYIDRLTQTRELKMNPLDKKDLKFLGY